LDVNLLCLRVDPLVSAPNVAQEIGRV